MRCRLYKRREKFWMKRKMDERLTFDDEQISRIKSNLHYTGCFICRNYGMSSDIPSRDRTPTLLERWPFWKPLQRNPKGGALFGRSLSATLRFRALLSLELCIVAASATYAYWPAWYVVFFVFFVPFRKSHASCISVRWTSSYSCFCCSLSHGGFVVQFILLCFFLFWFVVVNKSVTGRIWLLFYCKLLSLFVFFPPCRWTCQRLRSLSARARTARSTLYIKSRSTKRERTVSMSRVCLSHRHRLCLSLFYNVDV